MLYVYASGEIGYQPIREQVTFEFHNDTSSVKITDLKTVDLNFFIPYEPSTKIHRLYIDGHKVTVRQTIGSVDTNLYQRRKD